MAGRQLIKHSQNASECRYFELIKKMNTIIIKTTSVFKDIAISILMLGLLLAFTKLVKFVVLLSQDIGSLSEQFSYEKESIDRGSNYYVYNTSTMTRSVASSNELNTEAESLSTQIHGGQMTFVALVIIMLFAFVILYFSIDFLIEYTHKFKPWSIIVLLLVFVFSVFYLEIKDLQETGNGMCFMFTTMISLITGIVLIGYTLIFPNYSRLNES